jgi:hypothetical protein
MGAGTNMGSKGVWDMTIKAKARRITSGRSRSYSAYLFTLFFSFSLLFESRSTIPMSEGSKHTTLLFVVAGSHALLLLLRKILPQVRQYSVVPLAFAMMYDTSWG